MKTTPCLSALLLFCLTTHHAQTETDPQAQQASHGIPIRPSATDEAITDFDEPHFVYVNRNIVVENDATLPTERGELLLWIPGTRPPVAVEPPAGRVTRSASNEFCKLASELGYHVISLNYPNTVSAAVCRNDLEPGAFEEFRMALIAGGASKHITVTRTDSIENRLIKLLELLRRQRAIEGWGQFLKDDGNIRWERVAVAGQSQGGGHAALIGVRYKVSRVLCFGAPKDHSLALRSPAAWYLKESATPKERFFAFNHEQDHQGCTPAQQNENLIALKLDEYGPPVKVEDSKAPYVESRIFMTNHPGTKVDSRTAHGTMISGRNKALFEPVWSHMLLHE